MMAEKEGEYNEQLGLWEDKDGTVRVPMKGFPIPLFLEWNRHCVLRHKDCRWEKAFSDHEKARMFETMIEQKLIDAGIPKKEENNEDTEPEPMFMGGGKKDEKGE